MVGRLSLYIGACMVSEKYGEDAGEVFAVVGQRLFTNKSAKEFQSRCVAAIGSQQELGFKIIGRVEESLKEKEPIKNVIYCVERLLQSRYSKSHRQGPSWIKILSSSDFPKFRFQNRIKAEARGSGWIEGLTQVQVLNKGETPSYDFKIEVP